MSALSVSLLDFRGCFVTMGLADRRVLTGTIVELRIPAHDDQ
jgi:hypothetical protein